MSTRTTVEIDHEMMGEIRSNPITFTGALCRAIDKGYEMDVERLHRFGVAIKRELTEQDVREFCDRVYREVGVTPELRRAFDLYRKHFHSETEGSDER